MKPIKHLTALFLAFTLVFAGICAVSAKTYFISDGYKYFYADEGGIYIETATDGQTTLDIPAQIDGNTVTGISFAAFISNSDILALNLSNSTDFRTIGACSFEQCTSLNSVTFCASLTKILYRAFYGCTSLTEIDLSATQIIEIQSETFKNCTSLSTVTIPSTVTKIDNTAFDGCTNLTTIRCEVGSYAEEFALENGYIVDYIPEYDLGDVDMNNNINIRDATQIQKYVADLVEFNGYQILLADVDGNGAININDATTLQKYLARIITSLG